MSSSNHHRVAATGSWMALGAGAAVLTGSTPIGIVMVAGLAGALAWRTTRAGRARR
jgi:hypothetical protein